jgi:hypothetical protein
MAATIFYTSTDHFIGQRFGNEAGGGLGGNRGKWAVIAENHKLTVILAKLRIPRFF